MTSRRDFLSGCALSAAGIGLMQTTAMGAERVNIAAISFYDIQRIPDFVTVYSSPGPSDLKQLGSGSWEHDDIVIKTDISISALVISLNAATSGVNRVKIRWQFAVTEGGVYLGDAWERAYGDLEWRGIVPDRVMPWYFANSNGNVTHCYGIHTGPKAFCFWQIDSEGITLWVDVRSGGSPVHLSGRTLQICEVVSREGKSRESPHDALHAFCRTMCKSPRLPQGPVIGCNDWYYAYGNNSADQTRRDARTLVNLTAGLNVKPFASIDGGWQFGGGGDGGDWTKGTTNFPDIPGLTAELVEIGVRPGVWFRPLYALQSAPDSMRSSHTHALDPTAPGVLEKVHDDVARFISWGFQLVKHDFTTYDITGRWGFEMGPSPTADGWQFSEGTSRTTAEVIVDLYRTLRTAAGDTLINGCNTVSHLAAGFFEICRIGDDNSGKQWARTRKMGINCLAFRASQHLAFYAIDPDCVGITNQVPWSENRQMLDLIARSGAVTFISLNPDAATPEVLQDIRKSLTQTADCRTTGKALDWQNTISPTLWKFDSGSQKYDWTGHTGTDPFESV